MKEYEKENDAMGKYILIGAGFCSLGLGVAGIFIPVLPTTPFILLAASCFMKSSDRLYRWIRRHRTLGRYIDNYLNRHGITARDKLLSIALLWAMLGAAAAFAVESSLMRGILALVGVGVTAHLALIRTLKGTEDTNKEIDTHAQRL